MAAFKIDIKHGTRVVFSVCLFIGCCTTSSHLISAPQQQPVKQTHLSSNQSITSSACCNVSRRAVDVQGAPIVKHRGWTRKLYTDTLFFNWRL